MSVTPIERLSAPPQHSTHAQAHPAERACERVPAAKIVLWTVLFQLAWHFRKLPDILLQGTMPDPDDFLRLHQVRGGLAGQGWFDVSVARMNPPAGADMHWTRLADAPLAVLVQLFDLFTDATTAERLTAIVWPTLLLIATVFVVIGICERVTQGVNRLLALLFTVTCVYAIAEFAPGRIDHHGLQILLFCLALLGLVHREATWGPALTGATIALSIAIGIDAFLILLAFPLLFGLEWAVDGKQRARRLLLLAAGIGATALLAFVAFVPKAQWAVPHPDAISIFYLALLLLLAAALVSLAIFGAWLPDAGDGKAIALRMATGGLAACLAGAMLYALFPATVTGGLAGVDAELQRRWLVDIIEAKSMAATLRAEPTEWIATVAYCTVLLAGGVWAVAAGGPHNRNLVAVFALTLLAVGASVFQFRMLRVGIFAGIPLAIAIIDLAHTRLIARYHANSRKVASISAIVAVLLLSPIWQVLALPLGAQNPGHSASGLAPHTGAVAGPGAPPASSAAVSEVAPDWREGPIHPVCNRQEQFAALAKLPPGRVLNDLDSGPQILVYTHHTVLAGNYHRNGPAILKTLDFFESESGKAREITQSYGTDYIVICDPGSPVGALKTGTRPLIADILNRRLPAWLQRVSAESDRLIVLKVLK